MRKVLIPLIVLLAFCSCKKEYVCMCDNVSNSQPNAQNPQDLHVYYQNNKNLSEATKECEGHFKQIDQYGNPGKNCKIQ